MGVAIIHNDSAIIIDGVHDFYKPEYLPADSDALKKMFAGQIPFKTIVAIAVTHLHHDHFDSALVTNVANRHPSAILVSSPQVKRLLGRQMQNRVIPGLNGNNPEIISRKISHINPALHSEVENYRFDIRWKGFHIVHLGDAAVSKEAVSSLTGKIDAIIIPQWFLTPGGIELLSGLNPANIIVTHISPLACKIQKQGNQKPAMITFCAYGDKIIF